MNKRELKQKIKKISNVDIHDSKVILDDFTKKEYKNYQTRLKRLENKYNINLDLYKNKLKSEYSNLKKSIKDFNKLPAESQYLDNIEEFNFKFNNIKELIRDIDPTSKSKDFVSETEKLLELTQKDNIDISDVEVELTHEYTDLSTSEIEDILYPHSNEEESYYENILKPLLDDDIEYTVAKSIADIEFNEMKNEKSFDDIKDELPTNIQHFLDTTLKMRLINLGE